MKNHTDPAELYDEAVGDGASAPDSENVAAQTQLVESNASNYGASAIGPIESENPRSAIRKWRPAPPTMPA